MRNLKTTVLSALVVLLLCINVAWGQTYQFALQASGASNILRGATRGADRFVVVGNGPTVLYSTDGRSWRAGTRPDAVNLTNVTWGNSQYVATGDGGALLTSPDGVTWTKRVSGTTQHLAGVVWTGSRYIVTGQNGTILTSTDGVAWKPVTSGFSGHIPSVAAGPRGIVAVTLDGPALFSADGLTWTRTNTGGTDKLWSVAYGPSGFVVGGGGLTAPILFSADGQTWKIAYKASRAQTLGGALWDGDRYLVSGSYGLLLESRDGSNWTEVKSGTEKHFGASATGGGTTIVVASDATIFASATPRGDGKRDGGQGKDDGKGKDNVQGPSDGTLTAPVSLKLGVVHRGKISRLLDSNIYLRAPAYYKFTVLTSTPLAPGRYKISVKYLSGKKTSLPTPDFDYYIYTTADFTTGLVSSNGEDTGYEVMLLETGKTHYLKIDNCDPGDISFDLLVEKI